MDQTVDTWTVRVDADSSALESELKSASAAGAKFSRAMVSAFSGVAFQGKGLTDTIRTLGLSLSDMALKAAFKPLEQMAGNLFQGILGGGGLGGIGGGLGGGLPIPFASGGVISSPIAFPLGGGATGIAGERGAEAIMPLARGPDGRLGVASSGGARAVNVTFNISTPDVGGFKRAEGEIAAMLSRTVARGQRNL